MGQFVEPKVQLVGYTEMIEPGVIQYLIDSGNQEFVTSMEEARAQGLSNAEIMCSLFAKLCYKSLTVGHNANITRTRDIIDNLLNCFDVGHGSIFEHVGFNFIVYDCSRVFTHELVRHRIGTAFSQNSGRYIRLDEIDVVFDPILEPIREHCARAVEFTELWYAEAVELMGLNDPALDFTRKKMITSALRRFAPNGQSNEIAFSVNLRSLRHTIMMRTARTAEWEIRCVFGQIYEALYQRYPLIFHGAKTTRVNGIVEVTGMKTQPYERYLSEYSEQELRDELLRREEYTTAQTLRK